MNKRQTENFKELLNAIDDGEASIRPVGWSVDERCNYEIEYKEINEAVRKLKKGMLR